LLKQLFLSTPLSEYELSTNFDSVLFSVADAYNNDKFTDLRNKLNGRVCYDSGGFQFLMGKLSNPDPNKTLKVYEKLGYSSKDLLIQLDLPTNYYDSPSKRLELISRSALFYHQMIAKNKNIIPVVHGWTNTELKASLEQVFDSDTIGMGSYSATTTRGVGVGTYSATTRPKPGVGNQYVSIASGTAEEKQLFTPVKVVYSRLGRALSLLLKTDIPNIFVLGAGSLNMMHLCFASGAKYTDGSSWRIAARFWNIYVPEKTGKTLATRRKTGSPLKDEDIVILRELHKESNYPFNALPFVELMKYFKADKKIGFLTRAIHNAYVLDYETKTIANNFATDPEGYLKYLRKRWSNSKYWLKRLQLVQEAINSSYVQTDLTTFIKFPLQGGI
jgi:hypothetical protein